MAPRSLRKEETMRTTALAAIAAAVVAASGPAAAHDFGPTWIATEPFATLPQTVRYPEGIAANPANGDIFVATFDFGPNANKLMRFSRNGKLSATKDMAGTPMLGLGFAAGKVYALAFGSGQVLRFPASFDENTAAEVVATVPTIGAPAARAVGNPDGSQDTITFGFSGAARAPNGMVFDSAGNLYVSDSFQGAVFRIASATTCATPCAVDLVSHDPLLATAGFPPFGANGLALDEAHHTLYVANTGDNRVLALDLTKPQQTAVSVFAESIHGADGLVIDAAGRLWAAANQADQVVALNDKGRIVMRAGDFGGIRPDGSPRGMLFPASMAIVDGFMYVTNLALPLTDVTGDEPEEDVTRWNVVRFRVPKQPVE
jgi:DNA-binding beta-propeller fold protein YncE